MQPRDTRSQSQSDDTLDLDGPEREAVERLNEWIERDSMQVDLRNGQSSLHQLAAELRQLADDRAREQRHERECLRPDGSIDTAPEIEGYEIRGLLGRGGMGVVYDALDLRLQREVAIKALSGNGLGDEKTQRRFHVEVQAAAQLDHENIVSVFEFGTYTGGLYYTMRRIDGIDLAQKLHAVPVDSNRGKPAFDPCGPPVSPEDAEYRRWAVRLIQKLADALDHSHDQLVIHRDIKPANILIDRQGNPYLTDFGLARINEGANLTDGGDLIGTIRYMSPEQVTGSEAVGPQSDVYSLGLTLYEMVVGKPAITAEGFSATLKQISEGRVTSPRHINAKVERDLETIILKAIAPEARSRYASARAFAEDLERFRCVRPIHARRPTLAVRCNRWYRRNAAWATALGVVGVVALAIVIGLILVEAKRSGRDARTIRQQAATLFDVDGVNQLRRSRGLSAMKSFRKAADLNPDLRGRDKQLRRIDAIEAWSPRLIRTSELLGETLVRLNHGYRIERRYGNGEQQAVLVDSDGTPSNLLSTKRDIYFARRNHGGDLVSIFIGDRTNRDPEIKLYDLASKQLRSLSSESWRISNAWFTADSRWLVTTGWGGEITRHDLEQDALNPITSVSYPAAKVNSWVYAADADPSRSLMVSALYPGRVVAYRLPELEPVWERPAELLDWRVDVLTVSPDAKWVVAGTGKDKARLWHIESGQEIELGNNVRGNPTVAAFSADGNTLAVGDNHGGVYVWQLPDQPVFDEPIVTVEKRAAWTASDTNALTNVPRTGVVMWHDAAVSSLRFHASGALLVTSGSEAHTWRLSDYQRLTDVISIDDHITAATWLNEFQIRLTSRSVNRDTEWVWELPSIYDETGAGRGNVQQLLIAPDERSAICIAQESKPWDGLRKQRLSKPNGTTIVYGPAGDQQGSWSVSGDRKRITIARPSAIPSSAPSCSIQVFQLDTLEPVAEPALVPPGIGNVRLSHDGSRWLANNFEPRLLIGSVATGEVIQRIVLPNWLVDAQFLDGDQAAAICWDRHLRIWDHKGSEVAQFEQDERPTGMHYRDGVLFVTAGNKVYLYWKQTIPDTKGMGPTSPMAWRAIGVFHHEVSQIRDIAIGPNAKTWLSCDAKGSNRLWSKSGELIAEFTGDAPVMQSQFSRDGRWLATISELGTLRIYDGATGEMMGPAIRGQSAIRRIRWSVESLMIAGTQNDRFWLSEIELPQSWLNP